MPVPYPQFVYDFTAGRGIAMRLDPGTAHTLIHHLEGQVSGPNDIAVDVVKEIHLWHTHAITLPGTGEGTLEEAVTNLSSNAARGLYAALTYGKPQLQSHAAELLEALSRVKGIEPMSDDEARDALLICSVIYTLPRMTGAVDTVSDHVIKMWDELSPSTRTELTALISDAIKSGRTGEEIDTRGWIAVIEHADAADVSSKPGF
jgi:hypothetical protein